MSDFRIIVGDCREVLHELSDESVQCVVTSPPFWGLRDYGTATWGGGDNACDHMESVHLKRDSHGGVDNSASRGTQPSAVAVARQFREVCKKCGARRIDRQLGLESTPDEYVSTLVQVFREVRRVLRKDGTLWLNLGDSYAASGPRSNNNSSHGTLGRPEQSTVMNKALGMRLPATRHGLKPKDLVGIPFRVAFALQQDGWWLRSDIIWNKPNPMPESVRDRPTKAHEYLFLMSKSERYYYDAEAIREPSEDVLGTERFRGRGGISRPDYEPCTQGWNGSGIKHTYRDYSRGRNKRSVWTIATQPFPEAHFATFPEALVEPCVMAGSAIGDTVLDPFAGSGTVGVVCSKLGRDFIGIELNPEYAAMAERRIGAAPLSLFAAVSAGDKEEENGQ